jgi:hypothetical protein
MTAAEMTKAIGRTGSVYFKGDCLVFMRIVDAKISYGGLRYQVEPIAGSGRVWIGANSIAISEESEKF